nr:MFS transporter [Microbacterium thalassium]
MRDIESDLGIGSAAAGLMTTAPVLMFALLTPLAALVIRRAGAESALLASLIGVLLGTMIRGLPGFAWMVAGMLVIGAAVTIGNVVIPVIIRRDVPPAHVGMVTAGYAATLNVGSLLTALLTAPLAEVIGWSWALLAWSVITVAGILLWSAHMRRSGREDRYSGMPVRRSEAGAPGMDLDPQTITGPVPTVIGRRPSWLRRPVTWLLVGAFAGQTTIYYGLSTWLPTFAAEELGLAPAAAGAVSSVYQGVGIVGAFVVPLLTRFAPRGVAPAAICASWLVLAVGLLVAPQLLWVWLAVGAIGHSGGFVVIFGALVGVARSDGEAAGMSALVQGGGYAMAALAGPGFGAMFELTGGWTAPLTTVLVVSIAYCILLALAFVAAVRASPGS